MLDLRTADPIVEIVLRRRPLHCRRPNFSFRKLGRLIAKGFSKLIVREPYCSQKYGSTEVSYIEFGCGEIGLIKTRLIEIGCREFGSLKMPSS